MALNNLKYMKLMMKAFLSVLLISLCLCLPVQANTKYYQYNGDMPFIEMMLNMMSTMGMIDKVPPYLLAYGQYYNNPYPDSGLYMNNAHANQLPMQQANSSPLMVQDANPNLKQEIKQEIMEEMMQGQSHPDTNQQVCLNGGCQSFNPVQLNGVWMSRQGEMLGIKNQQFLWSDGQSRYLTGLIKIQQNAFALKVNGNGLIMSYQYRFNNNRLQTRDSKGIVRDFIRVPVNQRY
ncbi:MAG: hypothetical protein DIZ80_05570 [endosymbiont of Galathealinum brachiosum]|uniref:Uncharacterized protein n=1 Tax=endosymbiont of Galathealinum brachiosum TaxID=2200906 RepID=A0A370DJ42_9GAMM|nr:MAG: hypothetical protein DIZ80_05570 [endosymbiont of Galathealinum brachiosum]